MEKSFAEAVDKKTAPMEIEVDGAKVAIPESAMQDIKAFAAELEADFEAVEQFYDQLNGNPVLLVRRLFGDCWPELKEQLRNKDGKVPPARVGMLLREALNGAGLKN